MLNIGSISVKEAKAGYALLKRGLKIRKALEGKPGSQAMKDKLRIWLLKHPEQQICARKLSTRSSKGQRIMLDIVKAEVGASVNVVENLRVKTSKTFRFIDVAIPSMKLGFEFDGSYWHKDIEADKQRDHELVEQGWTIAHINENGLRYIS